MASTFIELTLLDCFAFEIIKEKVNADSVGNVDWLHINIIEVFETITPTQCHTVTETIADCCLAFLQTYGHHFEQMC